jgi:hypothetical protein
MVLQNIGQETFDDQFYGTIGLNNDQTIGIPPPQQQLTKGLHTTILI